MKTSLGTVKRYRWVVKKDRSGARHPLFTFMLSSPPPQGFVRQLHRVVRGYRTGANQPRVGHCGTSADVRTIP